MPKNKDKIIIGLVGEIASGKDTIADYLAKKYKSQTISFSQPLRDILDRLYLPQTRANMANLGIVLRDNFGQDLLAKVIFEEIKKSPKSIVCLPNIRLASDLLYLKKNKNFILISIQAEPEIRYKRITKRAQNKDDKTKSWAEFVKDSQLPTEIKIRQIAKGAKFAIDNNGTYDHLYRQIEGVMRKIKKIN